MADRYAVASGNWSSTSTWSATSGGPSGASAPVTGDNVYIQASVTVSLNLNVTINFLSLTGGTLNLGSYQLTVLTFICSGSPTFNLGSGTFVLSRMEMSPGATPTINAGTSQIIMNTQVASVPANFFTLGKTFYNVRINLEPTSSSSVTVNITGSPTFNVLEIRSSNTAVHTVSIDGNVNVKRFIALGSSSGNKLIFTYPGMGIPYFIFPSTGSSYGQNVQMNYFTTTGLSASAYIGSNSTADYVYPLGSGEGWVKSDPIKSGLFNDEFNTKDTTKWDFSGTTSVTDGLLSIGSSSSIQSKDTYDLSASQIIFRANFQNSSTFSQVLTFGPVTLTYTSSNTIQASVVGDSSTPTGNATGVAGSLYYYRILNMSGRVYVHYSLNGSSWTEITSALVSEPLLSQYKSNRINILGGPEGGVTYVDSVNPKPVSSANFLQFF